MNKVHLTFILIASVCLQAETASAGGKKNTAIMNCGGIEISATGKNLQEAIWNGMRKGKSLGLNNCFYVRGKGPNVKKQEEAILEEGE